MATTVISNVRVFDGHGFTDPTHVVIKGELIGSSEVSPEDKVEMVDGQGCFLIPGLVDSHIHLNECVNLEYLTAAGVTTAIQMACFPVHFLSRFQNYAKEHNLTEIHSTTVPGTAHHSVHAMMLALEKHHLLTQADHADQWVQDRLFEHAEFIKVIADTPVGNDAGLLKCLIDAAHRHKKLVVAHAVTKQGVQNALEAGVDVLTHSPMDAVLDEESVAQIAARKILVIPTLAMMWKMGHRKGYAYQHAVDNVKMLRKHGVALHAGTDANAGPCAHEDTVGKVGMLGRFKERVRDHLVGVPHGESLHDELERLVQCGLSNLEVLRGATVEPASWWGWEDRGVIAEGKRADLVLLEKNPLEDISATRSIRDVWVKGHKYVKAA